ncbi:MAG: 7-carboxy-7-deazaguanine synthase QueE [Cyanobacteria bacterium P01_E01_bin.42]
MPFLSIHETFQETIQGEGYWIGSPCDFIRLYGCPVGCPWCDTGYADGGKNIATKKREITDLLAELKSDRIVISGGEPFIQPNLKLLTEAILKTDRKVSIETSGCRWEKLSSQVWITLSPKEHINSKFPVMPEFWQRANEVKIVIADGTEPYFYQQYLRENLPVFLQPEWSDRDRTIPLTLELLRAFPHARLSPQLHKYLQIP